MRFFSLILIAFIATAGSGPARAQTQKPLLYQALTPVQDQGSGSLAAGLREGLATVLVRISGDRRAPLQAQTQAILDRAAGFAQGHGFEVLNGSTFLRTVFDSKAVNAALSEAGLPVWSSNRPPHLLWIAVDDGGRRVLNQEDAVRLPNLLEAADRRGLWIELPDRGARADFSDIWDGSPQALARLSAGMPAARALSVSVRREGVSWTAYWRLHGPRQIEEEWTSFDDTLDGALANGLHQLADDQARRFSARSGGLLREVRIEVAGLTAPADYARVLGYLQGLSATQSLAVVDAKTPRATFVIRTSSEEDTLARMIGAGSLLQATEPEDRSARGYLLVR